MTDLQIEAIREACAALAEIHAMNPGDVLTHETAMQCSRALGSIEALLFTLGAKAAP